MKKNVITKQDIMDKVNISPFKFYSDAKKHPEFFEVIGKDKKTKLYNKNKLLNFYKKGKPVSKRGRPKKTEKPVIKIAKEHNSVLNAELMLQEFERELKQSVARFARKKKGDLAKKYFG